MRYTLGEAAKAVGASKPTLSRAIKNGRLSADRLEDGSYKIDPAELDRWNTCNRHRNTSVKRSVTPDETPVTPYVTPPRLPDDPSSLSQATPATSSPATQQIDVLELDRLRGQLKAAELERNFLEQRIRDLTDRAERAEKKEDQIYGLLADLRPTSAKQQEYRKGFWARLVG